MAGSPLLITSSLFQLTSTSQGINRIVLRRKYEKKLNCTSALGMFYDIAIGLFIKKDVKKALEAFDDVMSKTCEIIRPGRANPKNHKPKKVYYMNKKKL